MYNKLKIAEFEVNMIYGFLTKPFNSNSGFDKVIEKKNEIIDKYKDKAHFKENFSINKNHYIRNGWNTFYNLNSTDNGLIQEIPIGILNNNKNDLFCDLIEIPSADLKIKWQNSSDALSAKLYKTVSIRKDGIGTLTLKFKFSKPVTKKFYCTGDILRGLLLVPRTLYGNSDEITKIQNKLEIPQKIDDDIKEHWKIFSFPYKVYLKTLVEELNEIGILGFNPQIQKPNSDQNDIKVKYFEQICQTTDTQVPYFFVAAKIDNKQYLEDIFEKNERRKKLFNELASILGRWLNEHNMKYVSHDYWKESDVIHSKFMNSLAYTIYSGMVTLMLYPELEEIKKKNKDEYDIILKPIVITHETILRYMEFARLRFHHAIKLNSQIDVFIQDLIKTPDTALFVHLLQELIYLEQKVSLQLENPGYYLWDSSLGSNLVKFFDQEIIKQIEDEINDKISNARNLLTDRMSFISMRDYLSNILSKE